MTVLPIRTLGDPVLREPARPIVTFDAYLRRLREDMLETMYAAPGVGLAAPQVGLSMSFFVYDAGDGTEPGAMCNPVLTVLDEEVEATDEGCLSIPGVWHPTSRAVRARAEGLDLGGNPLLIEGEGLMARILQHETDHLNGVLFIDRLDAEGRRSVLRELRLQEFGPAASGGRSRPVPS